MGGGPLLLGERPAGGFRVGSESQQVIANDSEEISGHDPRILSETSLRTRFQFKCHRCRHAVTATRPKLEEVLNTLVAAGVASISLASLAARLRSSSRR
jgi:hypothetical protein